MMPIGKVGLTYKNKTLPYRKRDFLRCGPNNVSKKAREGLIFTKHSTERPLFKIFSR